MRKKKDLCRLKKWGKVLRTMLNDINDISSHKLVKVSLLYKIIETVFTKISTYKV